MSSCAARATRRAPGGRSASSRSASRAARSTRRSSKNAAACCSAERRVHKGEQRDALGVGLHRPMKQVLKAAALYFAAVFAAGFVFAIVRVLWLVPHFGARAAELLE